MSETVAPMSDSGPRIPPQVPVTLRLNEPLKAHGEDLTELTIQPPRGKHYKQVRAEADGSVGMDQMMKLISQLANVPPSAVGEMLMVDIIACGKVIGDFFPDDLEMLENWKNT